MQCYTLQRTSLYTSVRGALMQDSVWYHLLQPEHLIQRVFGSSGILQTQYTGTSSTDFTIDSVARLSCMETLISAFSLNSSTDGDTFCLERRDIDLGAIQMPVQ